MLKKWKEACKRLKYKIFTFLMVTLGHACMRLLLSTCQWQVQGLERFKEIASKEKCILMLWHNRLAIIPFLLYRFAPQFIYAALVSNSRDGEVLSAVIRSYKTGRTIRVPHNARHQALRELVRYLQEKEEVVIITPDGPKGPCYEVKPGVAIAALEAPAVVIPLTWSANRYWEFKTWDKLRLPKPFSTIQVSFNPPVRLKKSEHPLPEALQVLKASLKPDEQDRE